MLQGPIFWPRLLLLSVLCTGQVFPDGCTLQDHCYESAAMEALELVGKHDQLVPLCEWETLEQLLCWRFRRKIKILVLLPWIKKDLTNGNTALQREKCIAGGKRSVQNRELQLDVESRALLFALAGAPWCTCSVALATGPFYLPIMNSCMYLESCILRVPLVM